MTRNFASPINKTKQYAFWIALFCLLFVPATFLPATLLRPASIETPEEFARGFADFKFCFHAKVQEPSVFLATKSGDCDDYATLAAMRLGDSGYETRLFAVRMKRETHVICYVPSVGAYLDYNNRAQSNPWVQSDGSLRDISDKVARSFGHDWVSAYEFSYHAKMKWLVNRVVFNRPPDQKNILAGTSVQEAAGTRNGKKLFSSR